MHDRLALLCFTIFSKYGHFCFQKIKMATAKIQTRGFKTAAHKPTGDVFETPSIIYTVCLWLQLTWSLFQYLSLVLSLFSSTTGSDMSPVMGSAWYPFNGHTHLGATISNWPAALSAVEQRLDSLINKSSLKHYYPTWWQNREDRKSKREGHWFTLWYLLHRWLFSCSCASIVHLYWFTG